MPELMQRFARQKPINYREALRITALFYGQLPETELLVRQAH